MNHKKSHINHINTLFMNGLSWGALESVVTQILLSIHTIVLFRTISLDLYGISGIIFSLSYLSVFICTAGVDSTLGSLLHTTRTHDEFKKIAKEQMLYTLLLFISCMVFLWHMYANFIQNNLILCLFLIGIIIHEIIKKTAKTHAILIGQFKKSAFVDLFLVIAYTSSVWIAYIVTHSITLYTLYIPLFVTSGLGALWISLTALSDYHVHTWKKQNINPVLHKNSGLYTRACACASHITHIIFSGNVLVPLTASMTGVHDAGLLKLVSNCIHAGIVIVEKMFGTTSTVLLAHTPNKKYVFSLITTHLIPTIIIGSTTCICSIYVWLSVKESLHFFPLMCAYAAIHTGNLLSLAYEKLLLDRSKGLFLVLLTGLMMGISYILWYFFGSTHAHILSCIAWGRLMYFIGLAIYTYTMWRIPLMIHNLTKPLCASFIFFALIYFCS